MAVSGTYTSRMAINFSTLNNKGLCLCFLVENTEDFLCFDYLRDKNIFEIRI